MYCPNCGNRCDDQHHYCFLCGTPLPQLPTHEEPSVDPNPSAEEVLLPHDADSVCTEDTPPQGSDGEPQAENTAVHDEPLDTPEAIPREEAAAPPPAEASPAPVEPTKRRKGRLWPPVVALLAMICVGLTVFFLSQNPGSDPGTPPVASDTPWFTIEDGVLYFNESAYTGTSELTIPESIDGQPVIAIAEHCFSECTSLTTVIIPETVQIIGDYAFAGCTSLRGIYIPESVISIGKMAFTDCTAMEAIYLPGSLAEIGYGSFDGCEELTYILYNGTYSQFNRLYNGYFGDNAELHTNDGTYYVTPRQ